ncbi:MAG: chorismate-binding protein [Bdellovibrionales bacterium]|nr:chorismate-binding protein [Bdellovibrionales bacterium]
MADDLMRQNSSNNIIFFRGTSGLWNVGWGKMKRSEHPDFSSVSFYLPDFFLKDSLPWWIPENFAQWRDFNQLEELLRSLQNTIEKTSSDLNFAEFPEEKNKWNWKEPKASEFEEIISHILSDISLGRLQKAVPIVISSAQQTPTFRERLTFLNRLQQLPLQWMVYGGWWENGWEGILGATPELLFSLQDFCLKTMALAGTAPVEGPSLLLSEKDLREHEIVVSDIAQQLQLLMENPLAGDLVIGKIKEINFGRIKHLCTTMELKSTPCLFLDVVRRLHPTPALGVYPRSAGNSWLQLGEKADHRLRFGAPFGVNFSAGSGECCVAIRNIQWQKNRTFLGRGCGIVEGSQFELEWNELKLKRNVVLEQLGFELLK